MVAVVRLLDVVERIFRSVLATRAERVGGHRSCRTAPLSGLFGMGAPAHAGRQERAHRFGRLLAGFPVHRLLVSRRDGSGRCEISGRARILGGLGTSGCNSGLGQFARRSSRHTSSFFAYRHVRAAQTQAGSGHPLRGLSGNRRGQSGAYAVEFGLVFLVFFAILYAVLTYGLMFAAQQTLNLAAQDGARLMLRVQAQDSMSQRVVAAKALASRQAQWVGQMQGEDVRVLVCGKIQGAGLDCPNAALRDDQVQVTTSYAYGQHPLIPNLPLLGSVMVPQSLVLRGNAVVQMGYAPSVKD